VSALCLPASFFGADVRPGNDPAVVEINGKTLTLSDLERQFSANLFQARATFYEAERKTLDQFIDQYLLQEQATKEGLTVDKLIEKHVNAALAKEPSDEALRLYYEMVDTKESFEALRSKIVDAIRDHRMAKAKAAYMVSLHEQAKITLRLAPPRAPLTMSETPARGPATARVTLLEYADYECPYCQQIQPTVDKLEKEYKGQVAFAYKDYPLPMHANAQKAAEATQCAAQQGKYWEYHDQLETTKQLDVPALKNHAQVLKLDTASFNKCLDGGEAAAKVKTEATEAQNLGVQGTPTFFVNGRMVTTPSYEALRAVINEELSATENASKSSPESSAKKGNQP
jgi:protein-disulfide isomerase